MQNILKRVYEGVMIVLVMLTISTLWTENTYNSTINWIVWFIFFIDFLIRLINSSEKWNFIKKNPLLVVAIIPFDQFFQIARIVRVIYLFRIKTITKYYIQPFVDKLTYKSKALSLAVIFIILIGESFLIWLIESNIVTFYDSVYLVFSHLFFIGHEIFEVQQLVTIWLLTVTSIIGIALHGLAIQWGVSKIENYYLRVKQKVKV